MLEPSCGSSRPAGALRRGLSEYEAVERAWVLTGAELYLLAVSTGWSDDHYEEWLADLLVDQPLATGA